MAYRVSQKWNADWSVLCMCLPWWTSSPEGIAMAQGNRREAVPGECMNLGNNFVIITKHWPCVYWIQDKNNLEFPNKLSNGTHLGILECFMPSSKRGFNWLRRCINSTYTWGLTWSWARMLLSVMVTIQFTIRCKPRKMDRTRIDVLLLALEHANGPD